MTAKEKAKELVDRFMNIQDSIGFNSHNLMYLKEAKQCALICVDEMIVFAYGVEWEKREDAISKVKFLKEVKQEIENYPKEDYLQELTDQAQDLDLGYD